MPENGQEFGGEFENMIKTIGKEAEVRRDEKMKNVVTRSLSKEEIVKELNRILQESTVC